MVRGYKFKQSRLAQEGFLMLYYDFVDVGTCDFDVADNTFSSTKKYLFVEPLSFYLNKLPSGPNIDKLNVAISNIGGVTNFFYVPPDTIQKYNLPEWIKGCSSINKRHPTVLKVAEEYGLKDIDVCESVEVITFFDLVKQYDIAFIDTLKIDTEGHDHIILNDVVSLILDGFIIINKITFEYIEAFNNMNILNDLVYLLSSKYSISQDSYNMYLYRNKK